MLPKQPSLLCSVRDAVPPHTLLASASPGIILYFSVSNVKCASIRGRRGGGQTHQHHMYFLYVLDFTGY